MRARQPPRESSKQIISVDRLRKVIVHPNIQALLTILRQHICGQRDDRYPLARRLGGPDAACRLESIHVRHETVEKEKIIGLLREGLRTAFHHIDPIASPFEQPDDEHLIGPVVISQENALSLLGARRRKRMMRDESSLTGDAAGYCSIADPCVNGEAAGADPS